jgi:hypothetical protein
MPASKRKRHSASPGGTVKSLRHPYDEILRRNITLSRGTAGGKSTFPAAALGHFFME